MVINVYYECSIRKIVFSSTYFSTGLARKEDFPYITYYCPHCNALNKPKQLDEGVSGLNSPNMGFQKAEVVEAVKKAMASASDSLITNDSPVSSSAEIEEVSERANIGEKAS